MYMYISKICIHIYLRCISEFNLIQKETVFDTYFHVYVTCQILENMSQLVFLFGLNMIVLKTFILFLNQSDLRLVQKQKKMLCTKYFYI